jgi:hypothetical protein
MSITFTIEDEKELNRHIDAIRLLSPCLSEERKWELKDTVSNIASLSDIKPDYATFKALRCAIETANEWILLDAGLPAEHSAEATPRDSVDQPE